MNRILDNRRSPNITLKRMGIMTEKKMINFYKTKNVPIYSLANEKMASKYFKIMRRFCFNSCFKGSFSTWVKI